MSTFAAHMNVLTLAQTTSKSPSTTDDAFEIQSQRARSDGHADTGSNPSIPLRRLRTRDVARSSSADSVSAPPQSSNADATDNAEGHVAADAPGWEAWSVVAASTLFFFVTLGLVYSFGVTQRILIARSFASASTLGWVSSTTVVFCPLLALPLQMAVLRFGSRLVGLAGALAVGCGYLLTSLCFSTSTPAGSAARLAPLFLAQSLFGIGYACVFWACNSLATQWFPPRRAGLATGIVYSGSGVGGAVFSIGLSRLTDSIGLENSLRVYGALALVILVPTSWFLKQRAPTSGASRSKIHWHLAKDQKFAFLVGATALVTFSLFVPPFFLPTYASSAGFSADVGAWLVAGYNLSSALGRIVFGVVADGRLGPVTTLTICIFLFGATILSIWVAAGAVLAPLIVFMLANGAAGGALLSLQPAVTNEVWKGDGKGEMQSVLAMSTMGRAFGSLLGAPLAGYLLDAFGGAGFGTGAYRPALLVLGCISLLACASLYGLRWSIVGWDLKKRV